eukprot:scaffold6226_cov118-Cylindrotheca_fusiformis.AAC.11
MKFLTSQFGDGSSVLPRETKPVMRHTEKKFSVTGVFLPSCSNFFSAGIKWKDGFEEKKLRKTRREQDQRDLTHLRSRDPRTTNIMMSSAKKGNAKASTDEVGNYRLGLIPADREISRKLLHEHLSFWTKEPSVDTTN